VALEPLERDGLHALVPDIEIWPTAGETDKYDLKPHSHVGAVTLADRLAVVIQPKLSISQVVFLISYALDAASWHVSQLDYDEEEGLVEALVPVFCAHARRAIARGLLSGYQGREDAIATVRGRIRIGDQIRRHFGWAPPIEVSYDEFTTDIIENQLIAAATDRLRGIRLRNRDSSRRLSEVAHAFREVSSPRFEARRLPNITYTRLNRHYRGAVEFAKLILRSSSFELAGGHVSSSGLLVDMNVVFEQFVTVALREALQLSDSSFVAQSGRLHFDEAGTINLKPDLSWWDGPECLFIGDVKYKRTTDTAGGSVGPNADLYQLLAYVTAARVPEGLLIYAAGERESGKFFVRHSGHVLNVRPLDLAGSPKAILQQIETVAIEVRREAARSRDEVAIA
jgi:5-methylcytosine-specific restriction enzyme subunit McrC